MKLLLLFGAPFIVSLAGAWLLYQNLRRSGNNNSRSVGVWTFFGCYFVVFVIIFFVMGNNIG
jgi:hypothetical protein